MKTQQKTTSATDSKNLEISKINLSKIQSFDFQKNGIEGNKTSSKSLYRGMEGLTTEEKKKHRGKLRRDLNNFVKDILGKDRSEKQRISSISDFLIFYKENWITTDFKIENFSEKKNEADLRDYRKLLDFVSSTLEE